MSDHKQWKKNYFYMTKVFQIYILKIKTFLFHFSLFSTSPNLSDNLKVRVTMLDKLSHYFSMTHQTQTIEKKTHIFLCWLWSTCNKSKWSFDSVWGYTDKIYTDNALNFAFRLFHYYIINPKNCLSNTLTNMEMLDVFGCLSACKKL